MLVGAKQPVSFITATGGTITTSGNYKIHTFTGNGTFTVTAVGAGSVDSDKVEYVVVAGGGSGGNGTGGGGGGGAGGYRSSVVGENSGGCSPRQISGIKTFNKLRKCKSIG